MHDFSYLSWQELSDGAIEKILGQYIRRVRMEQNKTQAQLSEEADISRSTLSLLERGEAGTISTFIKILRVLGKLQTLEVFRVKSQISPLALAKIEKKERQRVRHRTKDSSPSSDW